MNIMKTDGTRVQTRVADLKQISFLTVDEGGQGLLVRTVGGETVAVLCETNPVVTLSDGKLSIASSTEDVVEFEITDIAEMLFGDAPDGIVVSELRRFDFVLQDGGAVLRNIPEGVEPRVYTSDGRSIPVPLCYGELRLSRATLGTGIFVVRVGTFSVKIKL